MSYFSKLVALLLFISSQVIAQNNTNNKLNLWYDKPAANWNEALPIGNGRLAAMIYGDSTKDQVQLNEETIWAGEPGNNIPANVYEPIQQIRKLLFEGKYKEAQNLSNATFTRGAPADLNYGMQYQTAGSLHLEFKDQGVVSNYHRSLDIGRAISTVSYTSNGVNYKREYLASISDKVIIIRLTSSKRGAISLDLGLSTPFKVSKVATKDKLLTLSSVSGSTDNKIGKVRYQVQVLPKIEDGKIDFSEDHISITKATVVTIYVSIGTNFINYNNIAGNEVEKASGYLQAATKKSYVIARAAHIAAYQQYFNRVSLDLGTSNSVHKPTNVRVAEFGTSNDPALTSLYFQFGRYLLISSSLPGSQPANLQGKWNDKLSPPWDSKYTININTEMNYWPAEVTNLSEMHQPLFAMIKDLSETGKESAKKMYNARGWNVHHNTDLWRITGVVDGGFYGMWPMGGAWLSQHLWQHYLFTGDKAFLNKMYPVLKGAAMFFKDVLQEEPTNKWLVVAPSMSPENTYLSGVGVSAGTTMDNQLVFDVLSNAIATAAILNVDQSFADSLKAIVKRLPPMQVGKFGQLQEWLQDVDKEKDNHRHVSHLYGLFPSAQISPYSQPQLFEAAKKTLVTRGDKSTGWSMGWKVNLWARLLDGNRAYKLIKDQLSPAPVETSGQNGGTYPNLFDAHPPFQIDGNFGCTSGIAEMLLQSHDGAIHLLPALPDQWQAGSFRGLVARGGFIIDLDWKNGKISRLKIKSTLGGNCRIRINTELLAKTGTKLSAASGNNPNVFYASLAIKEPIISEKASSSNKVVAEQGKLYDFHTEKNKEYEFVNQTVN